MATHNCNTAEVGVTEYIVQRVQTKRNAKVSKNRQQNLNKNLQKHIKIKLSPRMSSHLKNHPDINTIIVYSDHSSNNDPAIPSQ